MTPGDSLEDQPMKWDAEAVTPAGPVERAKAVEPAGSLPQSSMVQENTQAKIGWSGLQAASYAPPGAYENN